MSYTPPTTKRVEAEQVYSKETTTFTGIYKELNRRNLSTGGASAPGAKTDKMCQASVSPVGITNPNKTGNLQSLNILAITQIPAPCLHHLTKKEFQHRFAFRSRDVMGG